MENVVEKLGFLDFINYIIVGMFTIAGCFIITFQFGWGVPRIVFLYLVNTSEVSTLFLVLCIFLIITAAYMLGMLCHESFEVLDNKKNKARTFDILVNELFSGNSCIDNRIKRNRYTDIAKEIFDHNNIKYTSKTDNDAEIEWNNELSNYFFTYCLYQVQIKGLNNKTEKLRDIEGLANSFCVSAILLLAFLLICGITNWRIYLSSMWLFNFEALSLLTLSYSFFKYRKKALMNRIRMTMALFEAIYDKDHNSSKSKNLNKTNQVS